MLCVVCAPDDLGINLMVEERSQDMTTLEISAEEQRLLKETLERSVRDLEIEVGHTDSHDFKEMLKQRKSVLIRLLERLQDEAVAA
jgi:hypothetical protein